MHKRWVITLLSVMVLVGCSHSAAPTSVPVATASSPGAPPRSGGDTVIASGKVVPAHQADIGFTVSGRVQTVAVARGDGVQPNKVLARLETDLLKANVAQAEAALAATQAQLALLKAGPRPEEIAAAEGVVATAQGGVVAAEAAVIQAKIGTEVALANLKQAEDAVAAAEAALAQAQGTLNAAKADLARAQAELTRLQAGARPEEIAVYEAQLKQARWELWFLTNVHKQLLDNDVGGAPEEQARFQMEAAQAALDAAQAQLDLAKAGATDQEIAAAEAVVSAAKAQAAVATAGVDAAEAALAQAQGALEAAQAQAKLAEAGVPAAEAQVEIAEGQVAQAQAQRDRLKAEVMPQEIAVLEAQVAQAEAALQAACAALDQTTLRAPFASTVTALEVSPGETALPGQTVLTLADLHHLQVQTTDLSERDVAQVSVGQQATVYVEALGVEVKGRVMRIASQANTVGGDVVYTVVVELDEQPPGLRWGMSVEVEIDVR